METTSSPPRPYPSSLLALDASSAISRDRVASLALEDLPRANNLTVTQFASIQRLAHAGNGSSNYLPEDLSLIREQTSQEIRPFLEAIGRSLKASDLDEPSRAVLSELKRIALAFLLATDEELLKGQCTILITEVQKVESKAGFKLPPTSPVKSQVVKLLFIFASYSRVVEYVKNISNYLDSLVTEIKAKKQQDSPRSPTLRPVSAPTNALARFSRRYSEKTPSSPESPPDYGSSFFRRNSELVNEKHPHHFDWERKTDLASLAFDLHAFPQPPTASKQLRKKVSSSRLQNGEPFKIIETVESSDVPGGIFGPLEVEGEELEIAAEPFDREPEPTEASSSSSSSSSSSPKLPPSGTTDPFVMGCAAQVEEEESAAGFDLPSPSSVIKSEQERKQVAIPSLKLPKPTSLREQIARVDRKQIHEKKVICRVCEDEVPLSLLRDHSKVCAVLTNLDLIAKGSDDELLKVCTKINAKLHEMGGEERSQYIASVDIQTLSEIRDVAKKAAEEDISAGDLVGLARAMHRPLRQGSLEDFSGIVKSLIQNKAKVLQEVEKTVTESPRVFKDIGSPRLMHSPRGSPKNPDRDRNASPRTIPTLRDFQFLKTISAGAFGRVFLARKKRTKDIYAVKVLRKSDTIQKNQIRHVMAEREILARTANPFVIKMYYTFQTQNFLYFVMDFACGGDLYSLLQRFGALEESVARTYIAETVLALEYIHSLGIVHRDLKPDNLLIDKDGHIKLTDFGLSNIGLADKMESSSSPAEELVVRVRSLTLGPEMSVGILPQRPMSKKAKRGSKLYSGVGTPEYLAPEILLGIGHSFQVDWWALGVVLYELLTGIPPFMGATPEDVFQAVLNLNIEWDESLSASAKDLISKLLVLTPETRLGSEGTTDIKSHSFFSEIRWDSILTDEPPFVPQLETEESTDYFQSRHSSTYDDEFLRELSDSPPSEPDPVFDKFWHVNLLSLGERNMEVLNEILNPKTRTRSGTVG